MGGEWEAAAMTEAEWLSATGPVDLLNCVLMDPWGRSLSWLLVPRKERARQRKMRLYLCACTRWWWDLLGPRARAAVEVAERYADGLAGGAELDAARKAAEAEAVGETGDESWWVRLKNATQRSEYDMCSYCMQAATAALRTLQFEDVSRVIYSFEKGSWMAEVYLVRCLFGNPFRPAPPISPALLAWEAGTVRRLAEDAYQERLLPDGDLDPVRLAILADALEDAGGDSSLVEHLRGAGPHIRGCWCVDALRCRE
jgi:hypothetical protein